jgi:hypothetical protein
VRRLLSARFHFASSWVSTGVMLIYCITLAVWLFIFAPIAVTRLMKTNFVNRYVAQAPGLHRNLPMYFKFDHAPSGFTLRTFPVTQLLKIRVTRNPSSKERLAAATTPVVTQSISHTGFNELNSSLQVATATNLEIPVRSRPKTALHAHWYRKTIAE